MRNNTITAHILSVNSDYAITSAGTVYNIKTNRPLSPFPVEGYPCIKIREESTGKKRTLYIHRLMAETFITAKIPANQVVDHIDGDKTNNSLKNLRVVSMAMNLWNSTKRKGYCCIDDNRYVAYIDQNRKRHHLGYFSTPEEARAAYLAAKKVLHKVVQDTTLLPPHPTTAIKIEVRTGNNIKVGTP